MDQQEMLYRLEEFTRLETFLGSRYASSGKATSFYFDKLATDLSEEVAEDFMRPSRDFFWNTDHLSLTYIESSKDSRQAMSPEDFRGQENGMALVKAPRFIDLIDSSMGFVTIIYVLKGRRKLIVEGEELLLEDGNAVILAPYVKNSSLFIDENNITIQMFIRKDTFIQHFYGLFVGRDKLSAFFSNAIFLTQSKKYLFIQSQFDDRFRAFVLDMLIEQERNRPYSDKIITSSIETFLYQLLSDNEKNIILNEEENEADRVVALILSYMRENVTTISIDELAHRFSFSTSYVTRLLKQNTGSNYIQLLTEMKLNRAKSLLSASSLGVEEIAAISGYNCSRQFRRAFRDTYGISPREFRDNGRT